MSETPKSESEIIQKKVTAVCNRITREHFEILSRELLDIEVSNIENYELLVDNILDKSLCFTHFHDLFADLMYRIQTRSIEWNKNLIDTVKQDNQWYYHVRQDNNFTCDRESETENVTPEYSQDSLIGPFSTREEAIDDITRETSFKRIVLNRLQMLFLRLKYKMEKLKEAGNTDSLIFLRTKERWFAVISFISHLYMMDGMVNGEHIDYCAGQLISNLDLENTPDTDIVLALCKLILLVGGKYKDDIGAERDWNLDNCLQFVSDLSKNRQSIPSRIRFRCMDVLEAGDKGWTLPDFHVDKGAKTVKRVLKHI